MVVTGLVVEGVLMYAIVGEICDYGKDDWFY